MPAEHEIRARNEELMWASLVGRDAIRASMSRRARVALFVATLMLTGAALALGGPKATATTAIQAWFQSTEQALMDAVGTGDKARWDRVMDPSCVITSEEGEQIGKEAFLKSLAGLPAGLSGGITVKELTVQEFSAFAVVRYLADEWEVVFGHRLATRYRVTDTFRRAGREWRMVGSHASVVTSDPPAQPVARAIADATWPAFVGSYRLSADGWTFYVELRDGELYGGRNQAKLRPLIALAPDAFVLSGSLGEYVFVRDEHGKATHIVEFRKFEPLVWVRDETPR